MKAKNIIVLLLIFVLIGCASFVGINGFEVGDFAVNSIKEDLRLGLDLKGGAFVVLEAKTDLEGKELKDKMMEAKSIIDQRVNGLGVSEPSIVIEGDKRIRVELPGLSNEEDAINLIGKTAKLQFIDPAGTEVLTGENVKESYVSIRRDDMTGKEQYVISLKFDSAGADAFREATARLINQPIYIVLDDKVISQPIVSVVISNGEAIIEGNFTMESAQNLAMLIKAGALPVELETLQYSVIGPTLGLTSFDKSVYAAMIGLIIVFLFMMIVYRIPGFVADVALILYILVTLFVMIGINATLTLPGIAGLILTIGMAVDANVIIFERIKEELRQGKSIRSSVDAGFKRALRTVMDANITTLIAGVVLYNFGTGPIKGFAVTLMIGIVASLFTAVIFTRSMLKNIIEIPAFRKKAFYGVKEAE